LGTDGGITADSAICMDTAELHCPLMKCAPLLTVIELTHCICAYREHSGLSRCTWTHRLLAEPVVSECTTSHTSKGFPAHWLSSMRGCATLTVNRRDSIAIANNSLDDLVTTESRLRLTLSDATVCPNLSFAPGLGLRLVVLS